MKETAETRTMIRKIWNMLSRKENMRESTRNQESVETTRGNIKSHQD